MNKIPALKPKELIRILKNAGFHEDRQSGSHIVMHSESKDARVSIPYHKKDLPMGTAQAILRAANLDRNKVMELLHA